LGEVFGRAVDSVTARGEVGPGRGG